METKARPYSYSDWMLIGVAAQALIDLYTPNGTFGGTVALACLCAALRFVIYASERITPLVYNWGGPRLAMLAFMAILLASIYLIPNALMYVVKLSGK